MTVGQQTCPNTFLPVAVVVSCVLVARIGGVQEVAGTDAAGCDVTVVTYEATGPY
jgi:hypothetical protein